MTRRYYIVNTNGGEHQEISPQTLFPRTQFAGVVFKISTVANLHLEHVGICNNKLLDNTTIIEAELATVRYLERILENESASSAYSERLIHTVKFHVSKIFTV